MPAPAPAPHGQHIHQQQQPQQYQQQGQPPTHPLPLPQHQQHQQQLHPQQQLQPPYDPSAMKLTRGTSCVLCQQRKVRCDKNKPCANCVKAKVECRVVPPQPPRRRKKRLQEKDLFERLRKYETLLNDNGVEFDPIGHELRQDGPPGDDVDELEDDFEMLKTSPETSMSPPQASVKKECVTRDGKSYSRDGYTDVATTGHPVRSLPCIKRFGRPSPTVYPDTQCPQIS